MAPSSRRWITISRQHAAWACPFFPDRHARHLRRPPRRRRTQCSAGGADRRRAAGPDPGGRRPAAVRPVRGRTAPWRPACAPGSSGRPISRWAMSSSSTPSATATAKRRTGRILSIGYLALVRERAAAGSHEAGWQSWYRYFPWEDWRNGRPAILARAVLPRAAAGWRRRPTARRRERRERVDVAFGLERLERGAGAGALRAALRGGPGAGGRPAAQASQPIPCRASRCSPTTAASSPPRSGGCAARSSTGRSCSS